MKRCLFGVKLHLYLIRLNILNLDCFVLSLGLDQRQIPGLGFLTRIRDGILEHFELKINKVKV